MRKQRFLTALIRILPGVFAAGTLLALYAWKGLYPFGEGSIAQRDMTQQYAQFYTHMWDVLHGQKALLFDWFGGGNGMAQVVSAYSLLSPLNLLLYLTPRGGILSWFNWMLVLKAGLAAVSACWFFYKRYPDLSPGWAFFFAAAYGLSGYVFAQNYNIMWLEGVILLPLIAFYARQALLGERMLPYALLLGLSLTINLYITAMICIGILLCGGLYWMMRTPRQLRGAGALNLIAGTLIGLLLSAWIVLPALIQMLASQRGGMNADWTAAYFTAYKGFGSGYAAAALYGLAFCAAFLPSRWVRLWQSGEQKAVLYMALTLGMLLMPLCFDSADTLWHFGGYLGFPYRMGFLTVFAVCAFCAEAAQACPAPDSEGGKTIHGGPRSVWVTVIALGIFAALGVLVAKRGADALALLQRKNGLVYFLLLMAGMFAAAKHIPYKKLSILCMILALLTQSAVFGAHWLGTENAVLGDTLFDRETEAQQLTQEQDHGAARIKTGGADVGNNSGLVIRMGTVCNWTNSLTQEYLSAMKALGQSVVSASITDAGGTAFSDALLGVGYTLSGRSLPSDGFEALSRNEAGTLYKNRSSLPFGLLVNKQAAKISPEDYTDTFAYQNALYSALGGQGELFTVISPEDAKLREDGSILWDMELSQSSVVYYWDSADGFDAPAWISVNGAEGIAFPTKLGNHCLELGSWQEGALEIILTPGENTDLTGCRVGIMDANAFDAFCLDKSKGESGAAEQRDNGLSLTVTNDGGQELLFLPVAYSEGWRASANGMKADCTAVWGGFLAVKLPEGKSTVLVTYRQPGLAAGGWMTLCALLMGAAAWIVEKKRGSLGNAAPAGLQSAARVAVAVICWTALIVMAVVPFLYGIYADFEFETRV